MRPDGPTLLRRFIDRVEKLPQISPADRVEMICDIAGSLAIDPTTDTNSTPDVLRAILGMYEQDPDLWPAEEKAWATVTRAIEERDGQAPRP